VRVTGVRRCYFEDPVCRSAVFPEYCDGLEHGAGQCFELTALPSLSGPMHKASTTPATGIHAAKTKINRSIATYQTRTFT